MEAIEVKRAILKRARFMSAFEQLFESQFVKLVLKDGARLISHYNVEPAAMSWPEDKQLTEGQYYIQKLGFHLSHTLTWCRQLDFAIEYLSSFDNSKAANSSQADHLIYNIENYLIRLNSVYDRVLQVANDVFHLCMNEQHVGHEAIVTNYKVAHRPEIQKAIKSIKRFLSDYAQDRHSLIHKHSLMDKRLMEVEMLFLPGLNFQSAEVKFRERLLMEYIEEKKSEFSEINSRLAVTLLDLFSLLHSEYLRQKVRLT
jgi:hypothetical protein